MQLFVLTVFLKSAQIGNWWLVFLSHFLLKLLIFLFSIFLLINNSFLLFFVSTYSICSSLPLLNVIVLTCFLGLALVLLGGVPYGLSYISLASYPIWFSKLFMDARWFRRDVSIFCINSRMYSRTQSLNLRDLTSSLEVIAAVDIQAEVAVSITLDFSKKKLG